MGSTNNNTINKHALDSAQDPLERFELMHPPPSTFDPYNDRPISTNKYATRKHVHTNGLWHCSVHIWIVNPTNQQILLQNTKIKIAILVIVSELLRFQNYTLLFSKSSKKFRSEKDTFNMLGLELSSMNICFN